MHYLHVLLQGRAREAIIISQPGVAVELLSGHRGESLANIPLTGRSGEGFNIHVSIYRAQGNLSIISRDFLAGFSNRNRIPRVERRASNSVRTVKIRDNNRPPIPQILIAIHYYRRRRGPVESLHLLKAKGEPR